jgi:hypothetical protein
MPLSRAALPERASGRFVCRLELEASMMKEMCILADQDAFAFAISLGLPGLLMKYMCRKESTGALLQKLEMPIS